MPIYQYIKYLVLYTSFLLYLIINGLSCYYVKYIVTTWIFTQQQRKKLGAVAFGYGRKLPVTLHFAQLNSRLRLEVSTNCNFAQLSTRQSLALRLIAKPFRVVSPLAFTKRGFYPRLYSFLCCFSAEKQKSYITEYIA